MSLAVLLVAAGLAADAKPEVFWQRVSMSGQTIGYVKREIRAEGGNVRCVEDVLVVIHDEKSGKDLRQEQHGEYVFGADLAPVSFDRVTTMWAAGGQVVRKVVARVEGGKLLVTDTLPEGQKSVALPIEQGLISTGAEVFLYATLGEGESRDYFLFDTASLKTSKVTVTRPVRHASEIPVPIGLKETSEESPSLETTIVFQPPGAECPNGRVESKVQRDSKGRIPETAYEACTAEEAQAWTKAHEH